VAEFTLTSLQSWQWASSSVYYLLCLWSRLISSVPYLKGEAPSMLDAYVPRITETFITSRLDSVTAVAGRYELNPGDPQPEIARFQPLNPSSEKPGFKNCSSRSTCTATPRPTPPPPRIPWTTRNSCRISSSLYPTCVGFDTKPR
jgi:hypothetical protein